MALRESAVLVPCHSLEDFPVYHRGPQADNLLAAWTAVWHPAFIAAAGQAPNWYRADSPPEQLQNMLLVVPEVAVAALPTGFLSRAAADGAWLVRAADRQAMLAQAFDFYQTHLGSPPKICPELVSDFLALGYCYLQVELLTRRMRYASNLDELHFRSQLVEAAQLAASGQFEPARQKLILCYNLLSEERDHYYSVDVYLLDLTLTAPNTLGTELAQELASGRPANVLLRAELLEPLARHPDTFGALQNALSGGHASLVGGCVEEGRWPLWDLETVAGELRKALELYECHLGRRPTIFARWRCGLTPLLPQLLQKTGYLAALHTTLDGNSVPQGSQAKTRWEGADGTAIDAFARSVLDAQEPGEFLDLAMKLGETMDMDHVATLCFAHWPGRTCTWYEELRRVSRHSPALGRFCTWNDYFRDTYLPGRLDRFEAWQYRNDYLRRAVVRNESDPIGRVATYWENLALRRAAQAFACWAALLGRGEPMEFPESGTDTHPADPALWKTAHEKAEANFVAALSRSASSETRYALVANPWASSWRIALPPAVHQTTSNSQESRRARVSIPGWGFARVEPPGNQRRRWWSRKPRPVAEGNCLRTDLYEAYVHPNTGGLLSVRSYQARPNLLSQQLAMRLAGPGSATSPAHEYTVMVADELRILETDADLGVIQSLGTLRDENDQVVARFRQIWRATRGDPVLRLEIDLEPLREPRPDPWQSYYACRFAWGDDTALVSRSLHETRQRVEPGRTEAPLYVEIDDGRARVAVLTAGLAFHRLWEGRFLDTLLLVRGESRRRFQLGIAVNVPHPVAEAWQFLYQVAIGQEAPVHQVPLGEHQQAGWLFRIGVRNVVATSWQPLLEQDRPVGFRVALLETAGAATRTRFQAFRPLASAQELNLFGQPTRELPVDEGAVCLEFGPYEWLYLEARFAER
ncbi:MAG: hypothetical protein KatS3mg110_1967 [Pirellulaceae bacterium]|nr:MAG: hypothetical protein KatS3mg110_1967 [Pirellulaceae bacterium]